MVVPWLICLFCRSRFFALFGCYVGNDLGVGIPKTLIARLIFIKRM